MGFASTIAQPSNRLRRAFFSTLIDAWARFVGLNLLNNQRDIFNDVVQQILHATVRVLPVYLGETSALRGTRSSVNIYVCWEYKKAKDLDEGPLSSPPRSPLFCYLPLIYLLVIQHSATMLVSGKPFAALIAAAIIGVTGSPVELEKRQSLTIDFCVGSTPGHGASCDQFTTPWNKCSPLGGFLDRTMTSINPYGFICLVYT